LTTVEGPDCTKLKPQVARTPQTPKTRGPAGLTKNARSFKSAVEKTRTPATAKQKTPTPEGRGLGWGATEKLTNPTH